MFGPPLANRAYIPTAIGQQSSALGFRRRETRQPLVVIRFDRDDVPYQQALYTAVSKALDRKPSMAFDVVAVAPITGTPAKVALGASESKRHAQRVYRSLIEMGLPGGRINISTTTSTAVLTNEVHVYVR